jgi:hypothetical protein
MLFFSAISAAICDLVNAFAINIFVFWSMITGPLKQFRGRKPRINRIFIGPFGFHPRAAGV